MNDLDTLRRLMPPKAEPTASADWSLISRSWGTEFPPDYRAFMDVYGNGAINNFFVVLLPEPKAEELTSPYGGMLVETLNAEDAWAKRRKEPELEGTEPRLIAWGADAGADIVCWDASGDDPAAWPVLVYNRGDAIWRRYDCGMVEFLVRVLRAEFAECPLSDLSLWGRHPALFLSESEEERLLEQGIDPWAG
ncbi:hypothetical protein [Streptomyces niveus]|uniref:hypothetical protein n=1 Tax=Streptomyces niveus TaxID=193462 RepID=UPI0003C57B98|nr:hypothetical protein [Streptomyces niveus]EST30966.1 hypothetical protein M877_08585 [Streptomyces niveus NCIMB 11891]